jgi:antitoxin YefM
MAEARDHLADLVESVQKTYDRVTLTRHGQPAAVLIAAGDLESLLETLDVLSTPGAAEDIQEGLAEYEAHKAGRRQPTGEDSSDSPADHRR